MPRRLISRAAIVTILGTPFRANVSTITGTIARVNSWSRGQHLLRNGMIQVQVIDAGAAAQISRDDLRQHLGGAVGVILGDAGETVDGEEDVARLRRYQTDPALAPDPATGGDGAAVGIDDLALVGSFIRRLTHRLENVTRLGQP